MADNIQGQGAFIPTTYIWEPSQIYQTEVNSQAFKELIVKLYQNMNSIQLLLNIKDTGVYSKNEFVNGQLYYPNPSAAGTTQATEQRQVFRKVIEFGALPNTATKSVAHFIPITAAFSFTQIYGAASNQTALLFLAIPNSSISISIDATNVNITTAANLTAYTTTYVVLEYLKH